MDDKDVQEIHQHSTVLYDPPSGWRYGFPKPYKPLKGESLEETLLRDGYPQEELDGDGARHVRFIGWSPHGGVDYD